MLDDELSAELAGLAELSELIGELSEPVLGVLVTFELIELLELTELCLLCVLFESGDGSFAEQPASAAVKAIAVNIDKIFFFILPPTLKTIMESYRVVFIIAYSRKKIKAFSAIPCDIGRKCADFVTIKSRAVQRGRCCAACGIL